MATANAARTRAARLKYQRVSFARIESIVNSTVPVRSSASAGWLPSESEVSSRKAEMLTARLSPQKVLEALPRSRERAIRVDQLAEALTLSESQSSGLVSLLHEFVRAGLAAAKSGRYFRKPAHGLLIGTLRGTRSGHAFVLPDDSAERENGDLFIKAQVMGSALHGDTVIARVTRIDNRGREGRVEAVL